MNVDEKSSFDSLYIRPGSIYALLAEEERRTSLFVGTSYGSIMMPVCSVFGIGECIALPFLN